MRISRSGPSVFAGRAPPFAQVSLLEGATVIATTAANANGDWSLVMDYYKLEDGDPKIILHINHSDPAKLSSASPSSTVETKSPAARLLKDFEGMVATAREEAKQPDRATGAANERKVDGAASMTHSSEPLAQLQRQDAMASLASPKSLSSATPIPITFVYNEATLTTKGVRGCSAPSRVFAIKEIHHCDSFRPCRRARFAELQHGTLKATASHNRAISSRRRL